MTDTQQLVSLMMWFAVAAVASLVGFFIVVYVRKWAQRDERIENFTFQDLRDMRARGEISEQEFQAMRGTLLAGYEVDLGDDNEAAGTRPEHDDRATDSAS